MDGGLICLLAPVLLVAGAVIGFALFGLYQRLGQAEDRIIAMSEALRNERDQRLELTAELGRHRSEIASVALRGEALRGGALVTSALPAAATDLEVEAAIRAALEPSSAPAVAALRSVPRNGKDVREPAKPAVPPVVTVKKAPLDDIEEHDIRNALGDTVRPPQPAAGSTPSSGAAPGANRPPPKANAPATPGAPPSGSPPPPDWARPAAPIQMPGIETLVVWFAASFGSLVAVAAVLLGLREVIALGYFGPSMRFATAIGAALGAWAFSGVLRWRKFDIPANALAGSGTAIAYAAIYAGYALYGLLPQQVAMASMIVVTAVSMYAAVRKRAGLWALLAALGGYATPLLLSTGVNQAVGFFSYLFLLNVGIVAASRARGWWWLTAIAGFITAALHVGWGVTFRAPDQVPVALGASLVLGTWFLGAVRAGASGPTRAAGFAAALLLFFAGMPFLVPADPFEYDPQSSMQLTWTLGLSAELGGGWLVIWTALLGLFSSGERDASGSATRVLSTACLALGSGIFGFGWIFAGDPRWDVVVIGLSAVLVLSTLLGRWRGAELGTGPLLAAAIVLAVGNAGVPADPGWMLGLSFAVSFAALGVAIGLDLAAPIAAAAAILPLCVNVHERLTPFLPEGGYVLLAMVVAFQVFAVVLAFRLRPGRLGTVVAVILAGPLAFWGFHLVWRAGLGRGEGALAVVLGLHVALAARMARGRGIPAESGQFAALLITILSFAALAVPLQLHAAWLTVGWAIEVMLLAGLSRRYTHPGIKLFLGVLASVVTVRLLFNWYALDYGDGSGMILLNWTLYTWGVPGVAFLIAASLLPGPDLGKRALRVAATLIFFVLVNLEVAHAFAHDGELSFYSENTWESMTRSASWIAFGVVVLIIGMVRDSKSGRLFGFSFVLLGGLKVCSLDVIQLPGWVRIGALLALAVGLILASIIFMRVVLRDRRKAEDAAAAGSHLKAQP